MKEWFRFLELTFHLLTSEAFYKMYSLLGGKGAGDGHGGNCPRSLKGERQIWQSLLRHFHKASNCSSCQDLIFKQLNDARCGSGVGEVVESWGNCMVLGSNIDLNS